MESELKVFVGKRNTDHYLAFDEEMNSYMIYGLYFEVGFFYLLKLDRFSKSDIPLQDDLLEIPSFDPSLSMLADRPIYKLSYITSNSSPAFSAISATTSGETPKGKQYQLLIYEKPFVETNPFECWSILKEDSPLKEWIKNEEVMEHTLLAAREGCAPNKKKCDLFIGNLKITGRREIKSRDKQNQNNNNVELQIDFWNDLVCNKAKIIFWNLLDPIPPQAAVLLNLEKDKVISFVGVYHLDSFIGQSSKSFITVAFDEIWTVPLFIQTRAFLEFPDLLKSAFVSIKTVPQMVEISKVLKRSGKDWQGVYFPFVFAGVNQSVRIVNTKKYQSVAEREEKILYILNQVDKKTRAEYEIEVWNGSPDNVNPIFIMLKNGKFSFTMII